MVLAHWEAGWVFAILMQSKRNKVSLRGFKQESIIIRFVDMRRTDGRGWT